MKRLGILGASGHGKVIAEIAELTGWSDISFYDDAWPLSLKNGSWDIVGDSIALESSKNELDGVVVAIGNNSIRAQKMDWLLQFGIPLVTLVHPTAAVSHRASIGEGSVVMANAVVNCDATIGRGAILNSGSCVDHDCLLEDYVHISPNATLSGGVQVGSYSWVGAGSVIRQLVSIGPSINIGAGAAVVSDLTKPGTYIGVPASFLKA